MGQTLTGGSSGTTQQFPVNMTPQSYQALQPLVANTITQLLTGGGPAYTTGNVLDNTPTVPFQSAGAYNNRGKKAAAGSPAPTGSSPGSRFITPPTGGPRGDRSPGMGPQAPTPGQLSAQRQLGVGQGAAQPSSPIGNTPIATAANNPFAQFMQGLGTRTGQGGDTMIAHLGPTEARVLTAMGSHGGINPTTGLPQFANPGLEAAGGNPFALGNGSPRETGGGGGNVTGGAVNTSYRPPAFGAFNPGGGFNPGVFSSGPLRNTGPGTSAPTQPQQSSGQQRARQELLGGQQMPAAGSNPFQGFQGYRAPQHAPAPKPAPAPAAGVPAPQPAAPQAQPGQPNPNYQPPTPQSLVAPLTGTQDQLINQITSAVQPQNTPALNAAQGQLTNTINGQYLTPQSNPFLNAAIQAAQYNTQRQFESTVVPDLLSRYGQAGQMVQGQGSSAFANSANQAALDYEQTQAGTAANMESANYQAERQRQVDAVTQAGALSQTEMSNMQNALQSAGLPQLVQDLGIQRGLQEYQDRLNAVLEVLRIAAGVSSPTVGQVGSGSQSSSPGLLGVLGLSGNVGGVGVSV